MNLRDVGSEYIYIYIYLYKSSLKFDHYYFITDGSLCLLYSIHSNAIITMSMVRLNFDLLLFHKIFCHLPINVINP